MVCVCPSVCGVWFTKEVTGNRFEVQDVVVHIGSTAVIDSAAGVCCNTLTSCLTTSSSIDSKSPHPMAVYTLDLHPKLRSQPHWSLKSYW